MLVSLGKIAATPCRYIQDRVVGASSKICELTFNVLESATTSLGALLPNIRPTSVGDVILQAKRTGSALLVTDRGDVLIEITQDSHGYFIFKATDDSLTPTIIYEGSRPYSGIYWEVDVSKYLQGILPEADMVNYGVCASRWKNDWFADLKKQFLADGLLKKTRNGVFLKLPDEKPLKFEGKHATLKAESVLKYFYQSKKTPTEEAASKPWDMLNRLFVGYLYVSGFLLAPWVNNNVMLPHQRSEMAAKKARQMADDGFLDTDDLMEMAKDSLVRKHVMDIAVIDPEIASQLESIAFKPNGYTHQYEFEGRNYHEDYVFFADSEKHHNIICKNAFCEEYISERSPEQLVLTQKKHSNDKIEVQKATFQKGEVEWTLVDEQHYVEPQILKLPDSSSSAPSPLERTQEFAANSVTVYLAALLATQKPQAALFSSLLPLLRGADALSTSKSKVTAQDIKSDTAAASKGALARRTAPISINIPLPDLTATIGQPLVENINMQAIYQVSNPNSNLELSIQQANGAPAPSWLTMNMGPISLIKSLYMGWPVYNAVVSGNYAYVLSISPIDSTNLLQIVDIRNLAKPKIVGSYTTTPNQLYSMGMQGNYVYIIEEYNCPLNFNRGLFVLDVFNTSNISLNSTFSNSLCNMDMTVAGNYVYITQYQLISSPPAEYDFFTIIDITNPLDPVQKSSLSIPARGSYVSVSGNYAYLSQGIQGDPIQIFNITDVSNPSLEAIISAPASNNNFGPVKAQGNYLYVRMDSFLKIYYIAQITNPILISSLYVDGYFADYLTVEGKYLYASCSGASEKNIKVIDIEDVQNPQVVATLNTLDSGGDSTRTFLSGNNIFSSDGTAGLSIFNAGQRTLSGTPTLADRGLLLINVTASDGLGNSVVEPIAIHVGDINILPIPNQQVYVGNSTLFTLAPGTFDYPGATFSYTTNLVGGVPLPAFISFDSNTQTFVFAPRSGDQNAYRIEVTADDGYGGTKTNIFDLSVPDRLPVVQQPLSDQTAYTGQPFLFAFNNSTFTDVDNDILSYSARLVGSISGLPGWLNFDPVLRQFYGTPFGKGIYPIQVTANDNNGGAVSNTFTITVPSSPPVVVNPPGTQVAGTGIPFSFAFNSNTFYDVDNDPLTYTTSLLPAFLTFNPATRTFSGTPQSSDTGTHNVVLTAQAAGGTVSTTFSLSVIDSANSSPPVLIKQIPDLTIKSGNSFNTTIASGTFVDPQGLNLTYTATLEGGDPLPTGLNFDPSTLTFSGIVAVPQALRITVKATDTSGAFAIDTFTLTVLDGTQYPPVVLNPLPDEIATVGAPFSMVVPSNTFKDINGEELSITVMQAGGTPLPAWLKWNPAKLTFSGTPGPFDTDTYSPRKVTINVLASDSVGSVKTSFIITVQGESFWATFIKYGFSIASVLGTAIGAWESRALIWNHFNKNKYKKKGIECAIIDREYSHKIQLDRDKVKEIKVLRGGKPLTLQKPFPDGLAYDGDQIAGIPTGKDKGHYLVRVIDQDGYINEEFKLIIKNDGEQDPVEEEAPHYAEMAKRKLTDFRTQITSRFGNNEGECFGLTRKKGKQDDIEMT